MAALSLWFLPFAAPTRAADSGFPIYFEGRRLILAPEVVSGTTYLPLLEIVRFLELPYTDATALETFTIRGPNGRLILTRNGALISVSEQIVLLKNPALRENGRWLVPIDFLLQGLSRLIGLEFRYRAGASRMFAGKVEAPELVMNAQQLGAITRLTIRTGATVNISVQYDENQRRAILALDRSPLDPLHERVAHSDGLVQSIVFDDADGSPKIVVETTAEVAEVRLSAAEGNRVFFVDFARRAKAITETAPRATATAPRPASPRPARSPGVIVVDPGHGGMDSGTTSGGGVFEKDITLTIARQLRSILQSRLGASVILTRDSDAALSNEVRATVANNNHADLFISLHIGHSRNPAEAGSSLFVMKEDFGAARTAASDSQERLFLPWYLGYRASRQRSTQFAEMLQQELGKTIPAWKFRIRTAPLSVLTSATMPSLLLELGNVHNAASARTMMDVAFQRQLVTAIVNTIERFGPAHEGSSF